MILLEVLNTLEKTHGLKDLVNRSILGWEILWYRDVYLEFDAYKRMGAGTSEAARLTAVRLNISEKTVYRAKKRMES